MAVIDRHTDRRTWRLYDQPRPEGGVGENMNLKKLFSFSFYIGIAKTDQAPVIDRPGVAGAVLQTAS